jgi:hypothetical protein
MATHALPEWNRWDILASPAFAALAPLLAQLPEDHFPTLAQLNRLCAEHEVVSGGGIPVEFVPQEAKTDEPYETRVYARGKVLTRSSNWHDLFNALVWITFPRSKAALNRHHYREMLAHQGDGKRSGDRNEGGSRSAARAEGGSRGVPRAEGGSRGVPRTEGGSRGVPRDVLTLFDESGVIVVASEPELGALLRNFEWKELFWQRRAEVTAAMRFYVFGHSIYEKALQPYKGLTAKTVIFDVAQRELERPLPQQLATLDARLAKYFSEPKALEATDAYAPLPVLGIPGWTADNEDERYYDDAQHFRPGRRQEEMPEEPGRQDTRGGRSEHKAPPHTARNK